MKNWKSILLLALVFFAGLVVGVVGTRTVARHMVQRAIAEPERFQKYVERQLGWKLRLDETQRVRLHDILTDSRVQLREVRKQIQPQVALIFSNANVQINALLTPGQQVRFEQFKTVNLLRFQRPPPPVAPPAP